VEEETERSLDCGNSVYNAYNLIKIFPDGTCFLENPETRREEKRLLSEINTDWLITVWNRYVDVFGIQEIEDNRVAELLQQMRPIASALITGRYIMDFTVHDTRFIRRTNAGVPFIWLVYKSGTHIYAMDDAKEIRNFLEMLDYYEQYSTSDFCLYRYDGNKLFPAFPKTIKILIESQLANNTNN
jgi:uncharacterized secreted protein with C-terminal beta-propeller domain